MLNCWNLKFQDSTSPKDETIPWCKEIETEFEEKEKDEEETEEAAAMDYDSLMAYFESLKESTA